MLSQFRQRSPLYLPDAFCSETELGRDAGVGPGVSSVEAETEQQDLLLPFRQNLGESLTELLVEVVQLDLIEQLVSCGVGDDVGQGGRTVTDRC